MIRDQVGAYLGESQSHLGILADAAIKANVLAVVVPNVPVQLLLLMERQSALFQFAQIRSVGRAPSAARFRFLK